MLTWFKGKGYRSAIKALLGVADPSKESEREPFDDATHPERLALLPYCRSGRGIDVGCGHRKTHENCIGVDILPKGATGGVGCIAGKTIVADVCTPGDDLHMFKDEELDFVVSRHNLEHYVDVIKTLMEWKRVLKRGGLLATILPDERKLNTIALDPTHKHAFTPDSFGRHIELIGGFEVVEVREVIPGWSFMWVGRKI